VRLHHALAAKPVAMLAALLAQVLPVLLLHPNLA